MLNPKSKASLSKRKYHLQNRDGLSASRVIKCANYVMEKTVCKAGRAWYISRGEM